MAASSETSYALIEQAMVTEPLPLADWLVVAPVVYCLIAGAGLMMARKAVALQPRLGVAVLLGLVALCGGLLVHVLSGGTVTVTMGRWLPPFGISFSVDLLAASLTFVASLVALACGLYGVDDVDETGRRYGFYAFLTLMMAGVCGAFLTGDIFNLYVWFEVLLIASFGLQVLGSERRQIDGATKYAFLNLVATTMFLVATGYLYGIFGTLNMADIALKARDMPETAPLLTLATLYFLAFAMKAAAFPLSFWLPASYHTPRVVVSALFAGLLTKVGVYALIRTLVMLLPAQRDELALVIAIVAVLTMILGVLGALAQTDYRRLLGYLVISGIGIMLAGVALASPSGLMGAIFYALHSIVVMTALYIAAGMAARIGDSFSIADLGGIYRSHVAFAALSLVLFFSVSGLPPFSGFWPKAIIVKAALDVGAWWLAAAVLVTGFLTTIAVGRVWAHAYWKPRGDAPPAAPVVSTTRELRVASAYLPLAGLAVLTAGVGLYPEPLLALLQTSAGDLIDPSGYIGSVFPPEVGQ